MSNSTTNLDLLSASQANKEVSANSLFDAASPALLYGRRAVTTAGLTWGYYGGTVSISGTPTQVSNGTVALTAAATNYVEADPATGAVSVNQTAFTTGHTPLYTVDAGASTVTSYTDLRVLGGSGSGTVKSVNTKTPDSSGALTLSASDVGADASGAASSAIAAHDAASDPHPQYLTQTEGDARYASSAAATGVSSVNGHTGAVTLAASDVGAVATSALGAANGAASLDSSGKLQAAQLPDLGIVDFLGTVASQTAMLALTGQKGDWCIRSDDGKVYTITGANPTLAASWTAMSYPVGNGGTVTSVDLAVPGLLYTVSGNPVTASGTLTFTLKTQTANTFLAGPTSGAAAAPTMRSITGADLPVMGASGTSHAIGAVPDPGATAGTVRYLREDGSWQVPPGTSTGSGASAQTFTSSGTWTKPAGCTVVVVEVIGAGGAGGGGFGSAAGSVRTGGTGGGGGAYARAVYSAADLSSTLSVTVGAGGTAGTGGSSGNGGNGGVGGTSSFGTLLSAYGGGGGAAGVSGSTSYCGGSGGGTGSAGAVGTNAPVMGGGPTTNNQNAGIGGGGASNPSALAAGQPAEAGGGAGGSARPAVVAGSTGGTSLYGGGGGGGGGSLWSDNTTIGNAGAGGGVNQWSLSGGGGGAAATGSVGAAGSPGAAGTSVAAGQGGGGGACNSAGAGGVGGAGGACGGGGGGGGGGTSTGGTGGAGGRGEVRIYCY